MAATALGDGVVVPINFCAVPLTSDPSLPRVRPKEKICDDETFDSLKEAVKQACKRSGGMSCSKSGLGRKYADLSCTEATLRLAKQQLCLAARMEFEQKCFPSIDERHEKPLAEHAQGVKNCLEAVAEKCGGQTPDQASSR